MSARARRCVVLRGTPERTREEAASCTAALSDVIWIDASRRSTELLGQSVDAVVLDLHDGIDADAIARAEGLVRGGGALVLRLPDAADATPFERRFARMLPIAEATPIAQVDARTEATPEQDALVDALTAIVEGDAPTLVMVLADRGRGKSVALGRAIARTDRRVLVTGPREEAVHEVLRFAPGHAFTPPDAIGPADVIVIDEAAQMPVAWLKRIVRTHPNARIVLATTCRGYEGTGRGFALRFLAWARAEGRPIVERTLLAPIRWVEGDPLERWLFDTLLLDAEPAVLGLATPPRHVVLDREALARDDRLLRQLFGLLVSAHYRTTPSDLVRLLDAPQMEVHALLEGDDVVAASLVAHEGRLSPERAEAMLRGQRRITHQALPDTLVSHALRPEAASLAMVRSVRIAVHEARRGRGYARRLALAIHRAHAPDLFGTIFGATGPLVRFRQALGYRVVRLGVARGSRSGEPAVVMVRPVSAAADVLVAGLRDDLARELPAQIALIEADDGAAIDPDLRAALLHDLPLASPHDEAALRAIAAGYASSTQPLDVVAASLARFVRAHDSIDPVLRARLLEGASWRETAARAGLSSVPAAMRRAREAVRALLRDAH